MQIHVCHQPAQLKRRNRGPGNPLLCRQPGGPRRPRRWPGTCCRWWRRRKRWPGGRNWLRRTRCCPPAAPPPPFWAQPNGVGFLPKLYLCGFSRGSLRGVHNLVSTGNPETPRVVDGSEHPLPLPVFQGAPIFRSIFKFSSSPQS